jgi:hypothetical protein
MHTVAPSLFWCIDLWNYVDARRCSVMLSIKGRAGRGSLVLAASAVRGRCPVYALGAAGLWNHVLLRTSSHLTRFCYASHLTRFCYATPSMVPCRNTRHVHTGTSKNYFATNPHRFDYA